MRRTRTLDAQFIDGGRRRQEFWRFSARAVTFSKNSRSINKQHSLAFMNLLVVCNALGLK